MLDQRVEGGRVNRYSCCMVVVGHSYGGLGGAGMELVVAKHARESQEGLVACREMPEHFQSAR